MNALELLREEHARTLALLDEVQVYQEAAPRSIANPKPIDRLRAIFALHTSMEKRIFYPAFESFCDARMLLNRFHQGHDAITRLLGDLSSMSSDPERESKLRQLRELVLQHVDDQERLMFVPAQELMGPLILEQLGRKMETLKTLRVASATTSPAD